MTGTALRRVAGLVVASASLLLAGLVAVPGHWGAAGAASAATAADAGSALAQAAATGQPVEVVSDRTDYSQTFAEPDGGFTFEESVSPVRVQQPDGSWAGVDTTLAQRGDGSVAPAAITAGLVLSGGGSGPLYTLSQDGFSLSVFWPGGALPAPSLSGGTARYASVWPGVDLLVSATPTGVSEVLEVASASAAANPALAQITFPVTTSGLSLSADSGGNISASGPGGAVFSAPPPQVWDSAAGAGAGAGAGGLTVASVPADAAAGPAPGDHSAVMGVSAGPGGLTVTPPASVLSGASTVYPVFIDPVWSNQAPDSWSDVWKHGDGSVGGDWEPQNSTYGGVRSGVYCEPDYNGNCIDPNPDSTWGIYRSYLNFSVPSYIWDAGYVDAQLQTNETWSWTCSVPRTVELYDTTYASQGLTWSDRPSEKDWQDSADVAYGNTCPDHGVNFSVKQALSAAAGSHWKTVTFELHAYATDESNWNVYSWKRFAASSMVLLVDYRHAPDKPTSPLTQGVFDRATGKTVSDCATSSPGDFVNAASPTLQVTDADSNDSQQSGVSQGNVGVEFGYTNTTAGNTGGPYTDTEGYQVAPADYHWTFGWTVTDGDTYKWSAYGETKPYTDAMGNSAPSLQGPTYSYCYFTDDQTPPAQAADSDISSDVYVSGQATGQVGKVGQFTFSAPSSDVAGYLYGIDNTAPSVYVEAPSVGGTATVPVTPFNPAELDLYMRAVDRAGNVSQGAPAEFQIITSPPPGNIATLAWWKLNASAGTTAVDSTGDGNDATLSSAASFGCGQSIPDGYSCAMGADGTSGRAFTKLPVLGNNGSFTVSSWVKLAACGGTCAAMSQGASNVSGFTLGYDHSCGCWVFAMPASDSTSAAVYQAQSASGSAKLGTWTQLTGVFDATHQTLTLFVNGQQAGQVSGVQPWSAPAAGFLRLATDGTATKPGPDYWDGNLSDACAFYGPLGSADVAALYSGSSSYPGDGCAALYAQYHP